MLVIRRISTCRWWHKKKNWVLFAIFLLLVFVRISQGSLYKDPFEILTKTKNKKIPKNIQICFLCHQRLEEIRRIFNILLVSYRVPYKIWSINNSFKFFKIIKNLPTSINYTKQGIFCYVSKNSRFITQ